MPAYPDKNAYIRDLFASETPALKKIRDSITDKNDQIIIDPEEGKLLQMLARMIGAVTIVEIGALAGYSTLWMAGALPPGGSITTIEKDPRRAAMARANLAPYKNITLHEGAAMDVLPTLQPAAPFDMVFIDADKLNYLHYLDWAEKNIRKGGLIVGDNTLLFDAVWSDKIPDNVRQTALAAMRAFNQRLSDPEKYTSILLPTAEGMTIAVKNF